MSSPTSPQFLPAVKFFALTSGALAAGSACYISTSVVPLILKAPLGTAYMQWKHLYDEGKKAFPSLAVSIAASLSTIAYYSTGCVRNINLAAAGLAVAIVPFTLLFMKKNISEIEKVGPIEDPSLLDKISKWGKLHTVRAALLLSSFLVSLITEVPVLR